MMICINRPDTNPYFNIAAEEYILKNYNEDVMMLWQNDASVILGKHQNTLVEVNHSFVEKNNIPVIRRISGGGTVYQDLKNINYTLIRTGERKDRLIDFRAYLKPIISFLETLGVTATFEGKNNLCIGNKKISGNSAHVYKNRVMHHGTILFDSDLDILNEAIKSINLDIEDKAVQSIRKIVTNITDHLTTHLKVDEFKVLLQEYLFRYHNISKIVNLNKTDHLAIQSLADDKYKTWNWNFGYSPKFIFRNQTKLGNVVLEVKNGIIVNAVLKGITNISGQLLGLPYRKKEITDMLNQHFSDQNKVEDYSKLLGF